MDSQITESKSFLLGAQFDFHDFYKTDERLPSGILPEEKIDISELLSKYQTSDLEIQRLKDSVDTLMVQVFDQTRIIYTLQSRKIIPIQNLRSRKLHLISPLYIIIERKDNFFVASSDDLNLYGYGETELNAIRDFCKEAEYLYFDLKQYKNKLGKAMKENWQFLKVIIKEL